MTATDELRRLLDERGVEYDDSFGATEFHGDCGSVVVAFNSKKKDAILYVNAYLTPEQAVEATLGRGTCHDKNGRNRRMGFECTVCGVMCSDCDMLDMSEGFTHFRYCPSCGRKVMA